MESELEQLGTLPSRGSSVRRRVTTSAGLVLAGAVSGRGATLVAALVIARLIDSRLYGQLALIQTGLAVLGSIAVLGLNLAVTKLVADLRSKDRGSAGSLIGTALLMSSIGGVVASAILIAFSDPIAQRLLHEASIGPALRIAGLLPLVLAVEPVQQAILYGLEEFRGVFVATLFRGLAVNVLMIAGVATHGLDGGIAAMLVGEVASAGITQILVMRSVSRHGINVVFRLGRFQLQALGRLAIPSLVSTALIQGALWGGQVMLVNFAIGFSAVAYFSIAYKWHIALVFVSGVLSPMALAMLSNLNAVQDRTAYFQVLRYNAGVNLATVIVPAACVMAFAPFLMSLAGTAYVAAWPTLFWLALAAVPTAANNVISQMALSLNLVRQWWLSDVVLAITLGALAWMLVPRLGATGLALAFLVGMIATCTWLVIPVMRATRTTHTQGP